MPGSERERTLNCLDRTKRAEDSEDAEGFEVRDAGYELEETEEMKREPTL